MPNCSASGCTNSSMKGKLMKVFPRDPIRRMIWAANVKRPNWQPTDNSYLCEDHFDESQWERPRVDGKRKLKCSAVPTLFGHASHLKNRKNPRKRNLCPVNSPGKDQNTYLLDHTYISKENNNFPNIITSINNNETVNSHDTNYIVPMLITSNISESNRNYSLATNDNYKNADEGAVESTDDFVPIFITSDTNDSNIGCNSRNTETIGESAPAKTTNDIVPMFITSTVTNVNNSSINVINEENRNSSENNINHSDMTTDQLIQQIEHLKKCVNSQTLKIIELKARLRKSIISKSKLKERSFNSVEMFTRFLNQDQLNSLRLKSTKGSTWSEDTLKRAIRLRYLCGPEGYKELLRQNYPLPSLRTIRRKLQIAECTLQEFYMNYSK